MHRQKSHLSTSALLTLVFCNLALVALTFPAVADDGELSYTFLEVRATHQDFNNIFEVSTGGLDARLETDGQVGFGLAGSLKVHRNIYLALEAMDELDVDLNARLAFNGEFGLTTGVLLSDYARLALGTRFAINERADFIAELGVEQIGLLVPETVSVVLPSGAFVGLGEGVGSDEADLDVKLGIRWLASRHVEINTHLRHSQLQLREVDVPDGGRELFLQADTLLGLGLMFNVGKGLGLGVSHEIGDVSHTHFQMRWRF